MSAHGAHAEHGANGAHGAHGAHAHGGSIQGLTTSATLHCLTGCAVGDFAGLALGVQFGLSAMATASVATVLGFVSGYLFTLIPLVRGGMTALSAWRAIWLGELISIGAMELAMNVADYLVGGMRVRSLGDPVFWLGYGAALVAGFAAAWPVNFIMLRKELKRSCH